ALSHGPPKAVKGRKARAMVRRSPARAPLESATPTPARRTRKRKEAGREPGRGPTQGGRARERRLGTVRLGPGPRGVARLGGHTGVPQRGGPALRRLDARARGGRARAGRGPALDPR